jgi:hypothetical protein
MKCMIDGQPRADAVLSTRLMGDSPVVHPQEVYIQCLSNLVTFALDAVFQGH